jgi:hypothetical protein
MKLIAQVVGMQSHLGSDCGFNSSSCPSRCRRYSKDCKNVLTQAITNPSCPSCVRHHISIIENPNCHTMGKFGKPHYHHKAIVNLRNSKMEVIVYIAVRLCFLKLLCSQLHTICSLHGSLMESHWNGEMEPYFLLHEQALFIGELLLGM